MQENPAPPADNSDSEELIRDNLRLVMKIANSFIGRGLDWEDLVAEGNLGLITAAQKYDPSQGKFSTYSAWWIKQAIRQAIADQRSAVRVPIGAQLKSRRIKRVAAALERELGHPPTDQEIAAAAGLSELAVRRLRNDSLADVRSLNTALASDDPESGEYLDLLGDSATPGPDQELIRIEEINQLLSLLDTLSERERRVLKLRFGLDGEPVRTLDEVGREMNCSNERVRQIQMRALRKLNERMK